MSIFRSKKKTMKKEEVEGLMAKIITPISLYLKPTNLDEEREKFFESSTYNPQFKYRKRSNRNNQIFSSLASLEEVTDVDPEISKFIIKVIESKKQASDLFFAIGNDEEFVRISQERFGEPNYKLFKKACMILRRNYGDIKVAEVSERLKNKKFEYDDLESIFQKTFDILDLKDWIVDKSKAIGSSGVRTVVKTRRIMMDPEIQISADRLRKTIVHEVATHALRGENGYSTGYRVFYKPNLIEYLDDEEGLAIYNEEKYGVLRASSLRKSASYVYSSYLAKKYSFREVFNSLRGIFPPKTSFNLVYRIKRGLSDTSRRGGYLRDCSYLRGFLKVRKKLENDSASYRNMYAGKLPMSYLYLVEEGILPKPKIWPSNEVIEKIFKSVGID